MTPKQQLYVFCIIPIFLCMTISIPIYFQYGYHTAWWVSNGGTGAVLFSDLVYIILLHSKNRWPGVPMRERMRRVFTFYKGQ